MCFRCLKEIKEYLLNKNSNLKVFQVNFYCPGDKRTVLIGNHSVLVPPDPIPNSVVKRYSADGSVGSPHVRVGHCQSPIK